MIHNGSKGFVAEQRMQRMVKMAETVGSWSTDASKGVGCVVFDLVSGTPIATGFNRFPTGVEETPKRLERPAKYLYVVHAETVALAFCARKGIATEGMAIALNYFPCAQCAGALIEAGLEFIIAPEPDWNCERWGKEQQAGMRKLCEASKSVGFSSPGQDISWQTFRDAYPWEK